MGIILPLDLSHSILYSISNFTQQLKLTLQKCFWAFPSPQILGVKCHASLSGCTDRHVITLAGSKIVTPDLTFWCSCSGAQKLSRFNNFSQLTDRSSWRNREVVERFLKRLSLSLWSLPNAKQAANLRLSGRNRKVKKSGDRNLYM